MVRLKSNGTTGRGSTCRSEAANEEPEATQQEGRPKRRRASRNYALLAAKGLESDDEDRGKGGAAPDEDAPPPSGRKRGRKKETGEPDDQAVTPSARRKTSVETPAKASGTNGTPSRRNFRLADRSARKKSARALINRVATGQTSDDEARDENLEQEIFESSGSDDEEDAPAAETSEAEGGETTDAVENTPSKRPRGRPKGSGNKPRKKSPTPPPDLPPHELYFYQNKPGRAPTSNNTLASLELLTHEEYFDVLRAYEDPHASDVAFLENLHASSFAQWSFELAQGFSVCLYGYGSKRALLQRFAAHLFAGIADRAAHKIVVVNGYVRTASLRDIMTTLAAAVDPSAKMPAANPVAMANHLSALLSSQDAPTKTLTVVLHSIDGPALRRPGAQALLAQLAAHPRLRLLCSADAPDALLLWDAAARASFNFAFHDCTTFAPPSAAELDAVDDVHELLGRTARRVGGRDGVAFVLRSLPENAKSLFRLLVGEVLVAMDEGGGEGMGESGGVEYRMVYNKAVEEFICSSEMAFRTLLKE